MLTRILMALCFVSALLPPLTTTDALACGGGGRSVALTPAEKEKSAKTSEARRKAVQARNIRNIDATLRKTKISASDIIKVKELRAQAAKLSEAGLFAGADQALIEAWKTLRHPEKFVFVGVTFC